MQDGSAASSVGSVPPSDPPRTLYFAIGTGTRADGSRVPLGMVSGRTEVVVTTAWPIDALGGEFVEERRPAGRKGSAADVSRETATSVAERATRTLNGHTAAARRGRATSLRWAQFTTPHRHSRGLLPGPAQPAASTKWHGYGVGRLPIQGACARNEPRPTPTRPRPGSAGVVQQPGEPGHHAVRSATRRQRTSTAEARSFNTITGPERIRRRRSRRLPPVGSRLGRCGGRTRGSCEA